MEDNGLGGRRRPFDSGWGLAIVEHIDGDQQSLPRLGASFSERTVLRGTKATSVSWRGQTLSRSDLSICLLDYHSSELSAPAHRRAVKSDKVRTRPTELANRKPVRGAKPQGGATLERGRIRTHTTRMVVAALSGLLSRVACEPVSIHD